jgi:membrane protein implicated in regulation of membrane protease activity
MKMAPGLFWGVLLVLIGLAAIFRVIFDINLFGVLFAFFLIFVGISMLLGKPWMFRINRDENVNMFDERTMTEQPKDNTEYNVIFGRTVYDFRNVSFPDNEPIRIKVNTIFGNSVIIINRNTPVRIKSDAVFAGATMPDGNTVAFGSIQYATDTFGVALNQLIIDAPVIFGALQVKAE